VFVSNQAQPREVHEPHTRLLRCALEIEDSRSYWAQTDGSRRASAVEAFEAYWFGARSLPRIEVLLTNMRARYDAFPSALRALHRWRDMSPDVRRVLCHWHVQLSDPLYREFSGEFLVERRSGIRPSVTRDVVYDWVSERAEGRWTVSTCLQWASKLLSAAYAAGLVTSNRDPRELDTPRIEPLALEYLLYLLREIEFQGTLLDNPYLRSVGLTGAVLDDRLRKLAGLRFARQASLVEFGWCHANLDAWADANLPPPGSLARAVGA
jgi:hypothetical protein